jgi:hypothetical protein
MGLLKGVIQRHTANVVIDRNWTKDFDDWYRGLVSKNDSHVKFFSGVLLGVYDIKFDSEDSNYIWDILLEAEEEVLEKDLLTLPNIQANWEVISSGVNHAFLAMMYLVATSKLDDKEKKSIILRLIVLLQFKFITSRHFNDWTYLANKEIALATYDSLSNQFKLKQYASWKEYLHDRAVEVYIGGDRRKDFMTILTEFDDDEALVRIISGISSNIGKVLNRWNVAYYAARENGTRLSLTSNLGSDGEGGSIVKDLDGVSRYRVYSESNIGNKTTFVNKELIEVIIKTARLKQKDFEALLVFISARYELDNDTGKFAIGALTYGLNRLLERKDLRDIAGVYRYLANAYGNNRSTSQTLENIRERGLKILKESGYPNPKESVVTVVCCYVVIWALLKQ